MWRIDRESGVAMGFLKTVFEPPVSTSHDERRRVEFLRVVLLTGIVVSSVFLVLAYFHYGTVAVAVNAAAESVLGSPRERLRGTSLFRYFLDAERERGLLATLSERSRVSNLELTRGACTVSLNLTLIRGEEGKPDLIVGSMRDITEVKEKEERLRQAQKAEAVGSLVGGISHDFNNLLTVINGYSSMMLDELPEGSAVHEYCTLIGEAGRKAADLTRKLLTFSRNESYRPEVLCLRDFLLDFEPMLRRVIEEDVELKVRAADCDWKILADRVQVEQILMNLASNARDAYEDRRRQDKVVRIGVRSFVSSGEDVPEGEYVLLEVADNGTGMDEETRARIFEPFFTTKARGKGTGMGLATVRGIVEQNGCFLRLRSRKGHGSTFSIYWSRVREEAEKAPHTHS